jgi:small subunit ribosomal protein S8
MKFKTSQLAANIKNAQNAQKNLALIPANFSTSLLLEQLHKAEFIGGFAYTQKFEKFEIFLKYFNNEPVIKDIVVFSKPSRRVYVNANTLKTKFLPTNFVLLSTSKTSDVEYLHPGYGAVRTFLKRSSGILTLQDALRLNIGGELLMQIIV